MSTPKRLVNYPNFFSFLNAMNLVASIGEILNRKASVAQILTKTAEGLRKSYEMSSERSPADLIFELFKLPNREEASISRLIKVIFEKLTFSTSWNIFKGSEILGPKILRSERKRPPTTSDGGENQIFRRVRRRAIVEFQWTFTTSIQGVSIFWLFKKKKEN